MAKVRFSCPRCQAIMQTNEDKIGFDIACPQCTHRFTLVGQESSSTSKSDRADANPEIAETKQWEETPAATERLAPSQPQSIPVAGVPSNRAIPPIYQGASPTFCCPYCQSRQPPIRKSEVSTVGWITCVILLTTCFFFWVGLLIRDKYFICSSCKSRLPATYS